MRQKGIDLSAPQTTFVELQPTVTSQDSVLEAVVTIRIGESIMNIPESVSDEFLQRIMDSLK